MSLAPAAIERGGRPEWSGASQRPFLRLLGRREQKSRTFSGPKVWLQVKHKINLKGRTVHAKHIVTMLTDRLVDNFQLGPVSSI